MKIYIYLEESAQESTPASITINKGNGGMPKTLQASEVSIVSKEELQAVLSKPKITATASGVVTKGEAVVPSTKQKAPQPAEAS